MPDIRALLHEAAPKPVTPLDMAAVRQRAERLPLRRLALWASGLSAVLVAGVGVPVGGGALVNFGAYDPPGIVDAERPMIREDGADAERSLEATSTVRPEPDEGGGPGSSALAGLPSGGPVATRGQSPPEGSTLSPTTTPDLASSYPASPSCSVDNQGLQYGQRRLCRFTATTSGGWNYYQPPNHPPSVSHVPVVSVTVIREGWTAVYRTEHVYDEGPGGRYRLEGCADGIIQAGDLVEVAITEPDDYWMDLKTGMGGGAGQGWGCTDGGS